MSTTVGTAKQSTNADDLAIFLDIVQLVNVHSDEDDLIEAVLLRLDQMKASAGIVFRRLDRNGNKLVPCQIRNASPDGLLANAGAELQEVLGTILAIEGTFEGHALLTNARCWVSETSLPDIEISESYNQIIHRVLELGCHEAHFFSVHATEPIGTLAMYSIGDVVVDPRRSELLERASQVLAFGIEKCRSLAIADKHRATVEAANARLTESNRDLQDFAHVASHDLQEPLRKIQAFGDRLESKAGDRLTPDSLENLQRMQKASQQMQLLINDLLQYSRVSSASHSPVSTGLSSLVDSVRTNHGKILDEIGGSIVIDSPLPTAAVDVGQFEQVLATLLSNAIKYRRPTKPLEVTVSSSDDDPNFHILSFTDNGIGFDQKYADRVFEPFKRLHSSADYEGSGIGLAVCRRIIDRHNGSISVQSNPGVGTSFHILLPKESRASQEVVPPKRLSQADNQKVSE